MRGIAEKNGGIRVREIQNVTIVGAGTMGHSLAQVFAQGGYNVRLNDTSEKILSQARNLISSNLKTLSDLGYLEEGGPGPVLSRIRTSANLEEAAGSADLVIEAIVEDEAEKKAMFARLDRICPPKAILASNTSQLDIFKFVETRRPGKVLITHWFAPPHIVPLVEVVRGPETSQETVDTVTAVLLKLGKKPIVIAKFLPGFIANRIQNAIGVEVFNLLDNGYATAEDIDTATKASFGLRMPILGLVKKLDFTGLDLIQKVRSNATYKIPPLPSRSKSVDALVEKGKLGVKTGSGFYEYGGRTPEEIM
ncbi:MAG TPA: 3-hydroxyacyl-CoA dehydrogenase family protein, partial [Thermodesulfobacteriota bacterium]|nr:3-hydroxyacyl-CoA dehydrogenase family protein [Thermodesulfobacteriota bacterium]